MKHLHFVTIAIIALFHCAAGRQTHIPRTDSSWALQFGISQDFTLSSFSGSTLSFQKQVSSSSALRVGISINANIRDEDSHQNEAYGTTVQNATAAARDGSSFDVTLQAHWVTYARPMGSFALYYGAGPLVGYQRSNTHTESVNFQTVPSSPINLYDDDGWGASVGVSGLAGVAWFANESIALHAEYSAVISRSWSFTESQVRTPSSIYMRHSTMESKSWSFAGLGVRFGLSVYFQ